MPELPSLPVILRVVLGGTAGLAGLFVVVFNWVTIIWNTRNAKRGIDRHVSPVPLAGPILMIGGTACVLWSFSPYFFAALVVDWPTLLIPFAVRDIFRS
jgi:hypothetical protein